MKAGLQRRLATGANATIVGVVVVVVVGLVVDLSARFRGRIDLSADGVATLQADTSAALDLVDAADGPVEIIATTHNPRQKDSRYKDRRMKDLLREMELRSGNVATQIVDLDRDRQLAEALEISAYGSLVVKHGGQRVDFKDREVFRRLGAPSEDGTPNLDFRGEALIARGMQQVLSGEARQVYVITGHGEPSVKDPEGRGLAEFADLMARQGWDVEPLDLLRDRDSGAPEVPDDADAVLLVAPTTTLDPSEALALTGYVRRGGSLGLWLEPGRPVPDLVGELGVTVPTGVAYDRPSLVPFDDWWLPQLGRHPIVDELAAEDIKVVFAHGVALRHASRPGIDTSVLLRSTRRGWLEVVPERPPADLDPGVDEAGPVDVGLAMELSAEADGIDRPARILLLGDADGITSELMGRLGNPTFAINGVRWLLRDDRMTLVGQPGRLRRVSASPEALSRIGWLVIGVWPLLVVLVGGIVWWLRRGR